MFSVQIAYTARHAALAFAPVGQIHRGCLTAATTRTPELDMESRPKNSPRDPMVLPHGPRVWIHEILSFFLRDETKANERTVEAFLGRYAGS